jgi:hypothetical protein
MSDGTETAARFLRSIDLHGIPTYGRHQLVGSRPAFVADEKKEQAVVIGSDIVAFTKGVSVERREAISDSALLAQLVANKSVPDRSNPDAWYDSYFAVLENIGWVIQEKGFSTFQASSEDADVHEAVLTVAAAALGPATAGYAVIKATLDALKKMATHSPWITLFERESQHSNSARFQISLAEQNEDAGFLISLFAFRLEATSTLTQVLFFKFVAERAILRQHSGKVSINDTVLRSVSSQISSLVSEFALGYVKQLPELGKL